MTSIRRIPHCSHWGAYHVLVNGDRVVGVEESMRICVAVPFPV